MPQAFMISSLLDSAIHTSLRYFHQLPDATRIGFPVTMARQRVAAAGGFNQNIRPDESRFDVDGRNLGDTDTDFVAAEPRAFVADDRPVRHLDDGGEKKISMRPPARLKCLRSHDAA
jgi:hypothetical protein